MYAESLLKDLSQRFKLDGKSLYRALMVSRLALILDGVSSIVLSRLLFCAGHVAQCQVLHCELHIVQERKKVRMLNPDDPGSTGKVNSLCF